MVAELTVATLNLRGVHDAWLKRERLVVDGLARLNADVICLQEAAVWCLQAHWLGWRVGRRNGRRYRVRLVPKRGPHGLVEGIAVLSALPAAQGRMLALGGRGRVAQAVAIAAGGQRLTVANTHLEHRLSDDALRRRQAEAVTGWLKPTTGPVVLCGDFNDEPGSAAVGVFAGRFRSVFEGLPAAPAGTAPAHHADRVIDYIMVSGDIAVLAAGAFLDEPVAGRWASDHIGLWARFVAGS